MSLNSVCDPSPARSTEPSPSAVDGRRRCWFGPRVGGLDLDPAQVSIAMRIRSVKQDGKQQSEQLYIGRDIAQSHQVLTE
jgi:hypothetical protein